MAQAHLKPDYVTSISPHLLLATVKHTANGAGHYSLPQGERERNGYLPENIPICHHYGEEFTGGGVGGARWE